MKAFIVSNWKHWALLLVVGVLGVVANYPPFAPFAPTLHSIEVALGVGGTVALPQLTSGK